MLVATYGANCHATRGNSTTQLARACDEKNSCIHKIDVAVLGDPAPHCAKDFVVEWTCGQSTVVHQAKSVLTPEQRGDAGLGSIVTLTCGDGK